MLIKYSIVVGNSCVISVRVLSSWTMIPRASSTLGVPYNSHAVIICFLQISGSRAHTVHTAQPVVSGHEQTLTKVAMQRKNGRSLSRAPTVHYTLPHTCKQRKKTAAHLRELPPSVVHAVQVVEQKPLREVLPRVHGPRKRDIPVFLVPHVWHVQKRARLQGL